MDPNRPARTYSREEMDEILRRALARQEPAGVTHDELVAAAREVGIDPSAIDAAADEVARGRGVVSERDAQLARAKRGFYRSLAVYLVVNTFLIALDALTPGGPWFYWVLLSWGLVLAMQLLRAFFPGEESPAQAARRELREARQREKLARHQERLERREARRARKNELRRSAEQFEHAVETGVAALLSAVARQVEQGVSEMSAPRRPGHTGVRVGEAGGREPVPPAHPTEREAESVARGEDPRRNRA